MTILELTIGIGVIIICFIILAILLWYMPEDEDDTIS